jgi:hypothetical protein
MLNVVILNVVILNVIIQSVEAPKHSSLLRTFVNYGGKK